MRLFSYRQTSRWRLPVWYLKTQFSESHLFFTMYQLPRLYFALPRALNLRFARPENTSVSFVVKQFNVANRLSCNGKRRLVWSSSAAQFDLSLHDYCPHVFPSWITFLPCQLDVPVLSLQLTLMLAWNLRQMVIFHLKYEQCFAQSAHLFLPSLLVLLLSVPLAYITLFIFF